MVTNRKRKKIDSSESDGYCVTKPHEIVVSSKPSPKKRKSTTTVHPSDRSRKVQTFEIVPPKPYLSDRKSFRLQTQPPLSGVGYVSENDQEEGFDGGGVRTTGANSASTVSESDQEAEGSDGGGRVGAKSTPPVSESDNEAGESDGDSVKPTGANSASDMSESDQEAEESDGGCARHKRAKTPEMVPPKCCAKRRAVYPSDRMKKFREEQAETDLLNPEATRQPHLPNTKSFLTEKNRVRFDSFWKKGVVDQRLVDLESFASLGVEQILKENHVLSTVTCVEPYVLEVVMEFYANLPSKETNKLVQKVFVRGQMYEFSPNIINHVLDLRERQITREKETSIDVDYNRIAATLTGGRVKDWTIMTPSYLSPREAALHLICCANLIPTSNTCTLTEDRANFLYMLVKKIPFNFGKLAYDQILRMGCMVKSNFRPVLPALIYQVLSYQQAIPLYKGESLNHLAKPICYHIRLSRGKHVSFPSLPKDKHASLPGRKRKHASLPGRKRKHASLPLSPSLKAYVYKTVAEILHIVDDKFEDDISYDEEIDDVPSPSRRMASVNFSGQTTRNTKTMQKVYEAVEHRYSMNNDVVEQIITTPEKLKWEKHRRNVVKEAKPNPQTPRKYVQRKEKVNKDQESTPIESAEPVETSSHAKKLARQGLDFEPEDRENQSNSYTRSADETELSPREKELREMMRKAGKAVESSIAVAKQIIKTPEKPKSKKHSPKRVKVAKPREVGKPQTPRELVVCYGQESQILGRKYVRRKEKVNKDQESTPIESAEPVATSTHAKKLYRRDLDFEPQNVGSQSNSADETESVPKELDSANQEAKDCLVSAPSTPKRKRSPEMMQEAKEALESWSSVSNDLAEQVIKTPEKPNRKKHRPKVVKEAEPRGDGKPQTTKKHVVRYGQESKALRRSSRIKNQESTHAKKLCRRGLPFEPENGVSQSNRNIKHADQTESQTALITYSPKSQENEIILFDSSGAGAIVPLAPVREQRPRVDLDNETNRMWKLLLGNIDSDGIDGSDERTAKWWAEERYLFQGRANSFIARMHCVQGNRRFSPWKGSVVDSVVGVFLTQNVSDHLSSSAYMSLSAEFPIPSPSRNFDMPSIQLTYLDSEESMSNPTGHNETTDSKEHVDSDLKGSSVEVDKIDQKCLALDLFPSEDSALTCQHSMVSDAPQNTERARSGSEINLEEEYRTSYMKLLQGVQVSLEESTQKNQYENSMQEVWVSSNPGSLQVSPKMSLCSSEVRDLQSLKGPRKSSPPRDDATLNAKGIKVLKEKKDAKGKKVLKETKEAKGKKKDAKGKKVLKEKKEAFDWDSLRREAQGREGIREKKTETMDTADWEAIRTADVSEVSETIKSRGMHHKLARRIQAFLDRLVNDHGSMDLEWLRDVPPDKAKEYLLSFGGLGLKSVECVRLLTLHHLAFPVDTNVGRIAVRLGWVPLQSLPESLQLHLLEMYPVIDSIQKFLWPRLCKLDQKTLYELHYQMITFGKVFCTKSKPNCNACPMRGECRHFASAFASARRRTLPGTEEGMGIPDKNPLPLHLPEPLQREQGPEVVKHSESANKVKCCEPIIEAPASPEPESTQVSVADIEDAFFEDLEEIPAIRLNMDAFTSNLKKITELQDGNMSTSLVALTADSASLPMPKLKNISKLRTEHQVYELPDWHPLLVELEKREPDDPCFYLLAIWTPGETADSVQPAVRKCISQANGKLCDEETCFSCNNLKEARSQTVRGTILIPCRTAMRGSFPLNGTYFQVNEVFADHASSLNPIDVPREWLWYLRKRTVYFGTSIPTIFRGLPTETIQNCFWRGYVCIRGFDRETRGPKPLIARLHFPVSKMKSMTASLRVKSDIKRVLSFHESSD